MAKARSWLGRSRVRGSLSSLGSSSSWRAMTFGIAVALALPSLAHAARGDHGDQPREVPENAAVPDALKPWVGWVLHGDGEEQLSCPRLEADEDGDSGGRVCAWPGRLALVLDDRGGSFTQDWEVFRPGLGHLPGNQEHWPLQVRIDNKPAAVVPSDDKPAVELTAGHHQVTGRFAWDAALPDALAVPTSTGLLALSVGGRRIDFPMRDADGQVFLGRKEVAAAEPDSIDISVHRKLIDSIPLQLITRLQLAVSGKSREVVLGRALPAGFEPQQVDGGLPLRFDPDGRIRLQVRPGTWTISVTSRRVAAGDDVTRPQPGGPWKEGEEVWVFDARPDLRVVDLTGAAAIDPAQTTLPPEWKALPAYALAPGATLKLVQRRRGDSDLGPDQLQLVRTLWLDTSGSGYTVSDRITGTFTRSWRLNGAPHTRLGRVAINGQDQFITRDADGRDGVEIRSGRANINADSRIEGRRAHVPATSFLLDFQNVSATLAIPPGWRLLHASGADKVTGTWIEGWSLLRFFLLLLTALAVQRLFGWRLALIALAGIGLTITESDAPAAVWLAVLLGEALVRALQAGKLHTVARIYRAGAWIALCAVLFPYAVAEVRRGVHPASERESAVRNRGANYEEASFAPREQALVSPEQTLGGMRASGGADSTANDGPPPGNVDKALDEQQYKSKEGLLGKVSSDPQRRPDRFAAKLGASSHAVAQNRAVYDPNVVVQTGPGLPTWQWASATLSFNAPVRQDQELWLLLAPPPINLILSLARVALLIALALLILRRPLRLGGEWHGPRPLLTSGDGAPSPTVLVLLVMLSPAMSNARALAAEPATPPPSPELLEELKKRLLEPPHCAPHCGGISRLALEVTASEMRIELEASAAARTAIPLPGNLKDWAPSTVRLDGKPAPALARAADGTLWLALPPGTFGVEMSGPLPARDSVQLALPMKPRYVTARVRGWTLDGLHEDGAADESLKLSRASGNGGGRRASARDQDDEPTAAASLPPFLRVTRTLHLGLRWEVDTMVARETPVGTPEVIDVPLLPGEAVTTAGVRVDKAKGAVNVSLGPDAETFEWHSTLTESAQLRLRADPAVARRWSETWLLDLGPTWHATFEGIPPIHRADAESARVAEWRPWPGEEVRIALDKPAGAGGQTLTVDGANLVLAPGTRVTRATLSLSIRSSRGTQHTLTLAAGADLESVALDGRALPLHLESDGRSLILPIAPRKQSFQITWREPTALAPLYRAPAVNLGVASTNAEIDINLSEAPRWVLWVAGPDFGPAVHIWSIVLVLLVLGCALATTGLTPLRWWDWTLLGIGMAQLPLAAAGVVALFLLALGWRAQHPIGGRAALYDLSQLVFVALAATSVAILFGAIEQGLVSHPDMRVVGYGSSEQLLRWYQDRSGRQLPRPWILSAPLMVYRGAMLAWALWLALACLRWSRWVWTCLCENGWWLPLRRKAAAAPPAAPVTEEAAKPQGSEG